MGSSFHWQSREKTTRRGNRATWSFAFGLAVVAIRSGFAHYGRTLKVFTFPRGSVVSQIGRKARSSLKLKRPGPTTNMLQKNDSRFNGMENHRAGRKFHDKQLAPFEVQTE